MGATATALQRAGARRDRLRGRRLRRWPTLDPYAWCATWGRGYRVDNRRACCVHLGGIPHMNLTPLKIAPTGMRLHEWIALERGYFQQAGIEPVVRWDVLSGVQSSWKDLDYKQRPQDRPFLGGAEPVDVINHCAWGSVCNAGAGMGKFA